MNAPPAASRSTETSIGTGGATLLVAFSACCFGTIAILVTVGTRAGARLSEILAWRYVIAAVLLMFVAGGPTAIRRTGRRALVVMALAGGGQAAVAGLSLSALRFIPTATMAFLFYTYPTWVTVIAAMRGDEPLTGRRLLALALSLGGIVAMVGLPGAGSSSDATPGVVLALSGALLYALYIPMLGRFSQELGAGLASTFMAAGAAVILAVVAMAGGGMSVHQPSVVWLAIGLMAVLCSVIAFMCFLRGLERLGPVRTAIVSTVEPFWGALLASLVLAQPLTPRTLLGGALVAAAVIILNLPTRDVTPAVA
jgi:drug/metabolite transporter (DMT)-like permease